LIPVRAPKQAPFSGAITPKTPGSFTAKGNTAGETAGHAARRVVRACRPRTEVAVVVDRVVVPSARASGDRRRFGDRKIVEIERLELLDQPVLQRELMADIDPSERPADTDRRITLEHLVGRAAVRAGRENVALL